MKFIDKTKDTLYKIGNSIRVNTFSAIDRYFLKELFPNYLFGLAFFTTLIMLNELFYLAKYYFEYNVPFNQVMLLLLNLIPFLLSFSVPFAVLPAYLLTIGRFNQDKEITAMKSCGVSTLRIVRAGLLFGLVISMFAIYFKDQVEIPSNLNYIRLKAKIMSQKPAVEFKERAFLEVGGFKISFDRMETEDNMDVLYNLYVVDVDGRKVIEAEKGRFYSNPENPEHYILKFMNGSMTEVNTSENDEGEMVENSFYISFTYLALNANVNLPDEYYAKGPDTMSLEELRLEIENRSTTAENNILNKQNKIELVQGYMLELKEEYSTNKIGLNRDEKLLLKNEYLTNMQEYKDQIEGLKVEIADQRSSLPIYYLMKYNDKIAMPFSAFIFTLISLSLGLYMNKSGRGEGLGISILIMIAFYGMKIGTENMILKASLPPVIIWAPNFLFFTVGTILFIKKVRE